MMYQHVKSSGAVAEKHLITLLQENRSLEQAVNHLAETLGRIRSSSSPSYVRKSLNADRVENVGDRIPSLLGRLEKLEGEIRSCFRFPNSQSVYSISLQHSDCIGEWVKIQRELFTL